LGARFPICTEKRQVSRLSLICLLAAIPDSMTRAPGGGREKRSGGKHQVKGL
ncbi:uncharacterized protein B0T23DRAFT_321725, partial [Neurospora hispaniola]